MIVGFELDGEMDVSNNAVKGIVIGGHIDLSSKPAQQRQRLYLQA